MRVLKAFYGAMQENPLCVDTPRSLLENITWFTLILNSPVLQRPRANSEELLVIEKYSKLL